MKRAAEATLLAFIAYMTLAHVATVYASIPMRPWLHLVAAR